MGLADIDIEQTNENKNVLNARDVVNIEMFMFAKIKKPLSILWIYKKKSVLYELWISIYLIKKYKFNTPYNICKIFFLILMVGGGGGGSGF